ncbi:hypothetical protein GBA52_021105 [Prunus armeniaca]|nr:hypothetical protein GBA52_021105 [Prunus armeniaca]
MEKGSHVLEWPWSASLFLLLQKTKRIAANTTAINDPTLAPTITPTLPFELEFEEGTREFAPLRLPAELFIFIISSPFRMALG